VVRPGPAADPATEPLNRSAGHDLGWLAVYGMAPWGHCCIKAKGVLATHQSGEAGPSGTLKNRNKPGIRDLLRGFWASRWTRSGEPIA
jgi:hypothetical protein